MKWYSKPIEPTDGDALLEKWGLPKVEDEDDDDGEGLNTYVEPMLSAEDALKPEGWDEKRSGKDRREMTLSSRLDDAAAKGGIMSDRTRQALGLSEKVGPMTLKDLIKELIDMFDEVGNVPISTGRGTSLSSPVVGYDTDNDWVTIK